MEKRLIDANALKPLLREYCIDGDEVVAKWYDIMGVDEVVDRSPTIDAVPVIRCKDCRWFGKIGCAIEVVDETDMPKENDFCSFAERKDDEH